MGANFRNFSIRKCNVFWTIYALRFVVFLFTIGWKVLSKFQLRDNMIMIEKIRFGIVVALASEFGPFCVVLSGVT